MLTNNPLVTLVSKLLNYPPISLVRNVIFLLFVFNYSKHASRLISLHGFQGALTIALKSVLKHVIVALRKTVPAANATVEKEVGKAVASMEKSMIVKTPGAKEYKTLPKEGLDVASVKTELARYRDMAKEDWKAGKVSGAIYNGNPELAALVTDAYGMFALTNVSFDFQMYCRWLRV